MTLLPQTIRSKRTSGALSCSRALKCSLLSVHIGTITHVLAISGQHVAVLVALIWLYIVVAGAPPSALRARVNATLVLGARFFGRQVSPV
jgi:predicted membrane metal-binding protein